MSNGLTLIPAVIEVMGRRKYAGEIEPLPGAPFVRLHIPACVTHSRDYDWSRDLETGEDSCTLVEEVREYGEMVVDLGSSGIFAITYCDADEVLEELSAPGSSVERGPLISTTRAPVPPSVDVPIPPPVAQAGQEDEREPTEEEPPEAVLVNGRALEEFLDTIPTPVDLPPEVERAIEDLVDERPPSTPTAEQRAMAESLDRALDLLGSGAPIEDQIAAVQQATAALDAMDAAPLTVPVPDATAEELRPPVILVPPPAPASPEPPLSEWMQCAQVIDGVRCGREVRYLGATFCSDHAPVQAA